MNLKFRLLTIFCFCAILATAQSIPQIKVEGQGITSALPELLIINIPVSAQAVEYQACVSKLTSTYNRLEQEIEKAGYKKETLKNSGFSINEKYSYNGQTRVKDGYSGNMNIQMELEYTDQSMNDMIEVLAMPEFNFGFSLSYKLTKEQKNELASLALKEAVNDAQRQAETMAAAIGKKLGTVLEMNYNVRQNQGGPIMYEAVMLKADNGAVADVELNPNEISISKNVTIHYSIASE